MAAPTPRFFAWTTTRTRGSPTASAASFVPSWLASSTTTTWSTSRGSPRSTRPMRGASFQAGTTTTTGTPKSTVHPGYHASSCRVEASVVRTRTWVGIVVVGLLLFLGTGAVMHRPFPSDQTPEGAYLRIAKSIDEGHPREMFAYLETDAQWA